MLKDFPQDHKSLEATLRSLILERDQQKQRAEQESKRANGLYLENLRLQLELERYKKWYYGPRADRLATSGDVVQVLLEFAEQLEAKPIHAEDVPGKAELEYELAASEAATGATASRQLRKSSAYDQDLRTQRRGTNLSRLRSGA